MRERIAFVIHRYGEGVGGGAEDHCRAVSEHLLKYYNVDVLTSTSRNYPYRDYFKKGKDILNGVVIMRFAIERRFDKTKEDYYKKKMMRGDQGAEERWMEENGPFCPSLVVYLKENAEHYKAIFLFGHNHYLTYGCIKLNIPNLILIPLAHDDRMIRTSAAKTVFSRANAFMFNTVEEMELVGKMFGVTNVPHRVTCFGIDIVEVSGDIEEQYNGLGNYIIYAGRVTHNKNYSELNRYFIEYKKGHHTDLKLVVIGRVMDGFDIEWHEDIVYLGYVSEAEKRVLLHNAKLLVLPSKLESLSIVILESFMQRRPVLVNGKCPVLAGQCRRSNGGLYYKSYTEFEAELQYMLDNPDIRIAMGMNGYEYVKTNYTWDKVLKNFLEIIDEVS